MRIILSLFIMGLVSFTAHAGPKAPGTITAKLLTLKKADCSPVTRDKHKGKCVMSFEEQGYGGLTEIEATLDVASPWLEGSKSMPVRSRLTVEISPDNEVMRIDDKDGKTLSLKPDETQKTANTTPVTTEETIQVSSPRNGFK